jgi:hypothetical protein
MNRWLVIPAVSSAFAFALMMATLHGAAARGPAVEFRIPSATGNTGTPMRASNVSHANGDPLLTIPQAEELLTTLATEYIRPWQQWEASPRHFYSRAAPRPIPPISSRIEIARDSNEPSDGFLLGLVVVNTGERSQWMPCVVDRSNKEVRFFAEGQWLSQEEWLKKAPRPYGRSWLKQDWHRHWIRWLRSTSCRTCVTFRRIAHLRSHITDSAFEALKHYSQVTEADFERAADGSAKGGAESGARSAQNAAQRERATIRGELQETKQAPDESRACAIFPDVCGEIEHLFSGEDRIRTCGPVWPGHGFSKAAL